MRTLVLLGAGLAVVLLGSRAAQARGPRKLTKADLPKLRELYLRKTDIIREVNLCASAPGAGSLLDGAQYTGVVAGLAAGVASGGDMGLALKVAKGGAAIAGLLGLGRSHPCPDLPAKLAPKLAQHDQLSEQLELARELTPKDIAELAAPLGGLNDAAAVGYGPAWTDAQRRATQAYADATEREVENPRYLRQLGIR